MPVVTITLKDNGTAGFEMNMASEPAFKQPLTPAQTAAIAMIEYLKENSDTSEDTVEHEQ